MEVRTPELCGLNLYRSPMAVYWEKTTDTLDLSDNEAMRQGRFGKIMLHSGLQKRQVKRCGVPNKMYWSEEHPFMYADVDRLLVGKMQVWSVRR